jgi:hypothetical protein
MFTKSLVFLVSLLGATAGLALADSHPATYAKRTAPLGVPFELNGQSYKLMRAPFKAFDGGKYALIYPNTVLAFGSGGGGFTTLHADKPLVSNTAISGFPASVSIKDIRTYALGGAIGHAGALRVRSSAIGTITIQIGTTRVLVILEQIKDLPDWFGDPNGCCSPYTETRIEVGTAVDATPFADWTTWRDLKPEAQAIDTLLDYIQVIPL